MKAEEKTGFKKWIQDSYFGKDVKTVLTTTVDVVETAGTVVGGIMSIVGIVGALVKLAEFLEFNKQQPDRLQLLLEMVQRIENKLDALFDWNTDAEWNRVLGDLSEAT